MEQKYGIKSVSIAAVETKTSAQETFIKSSKRAFRNFYLTKLHLEYGFYERYFIWWLQDSSIEYTDDYNRETVSIEVGLSIPSHRLGNSIRSIGTRIWSF